MYTINLTTRELAVLDRVVDNAIHEAENYKYDALRAYHDAIGDAEEIATTSRALDYWREQLRILRRIAGTLRKTEEAADP